MGKSLWRWIHGNQLRINIGRFVDVVANQKRKYSALNFTLDNKVGCLTQIGQFNFGIPNSIAASKTSNILYLIVRFIFYFHSQPKALKPLREAIPNFLIRLNNPSMKAIDTSDVAQWFKYNNTYNFLHQMNTSSNVSGSHFFFLFSNKFAQNFVESNR